MDEQDAGKREVSKIGFPYLDLDDAIGVAKAMWEKGGVPMDRDQLAAALGQVSSSGAFNAKLSTARMFGVLESTNGRYELTDLGRDIVEPTLAAAAKVQAFLNVPLYKRTFEEFRGRQLPPKPIGLEQAFVSFGVAAKQKDKARHAFERSARSAGFFPNSNEDRLVIPIVAAGTRPENGGEGRRDPEAASPPPPPPAPEGTGDPLVDALVKKLPKAGGHWSLDDRATWLKMIDMAFQLAYRETKSAEADPIAAVLG